MARRPQHPADLHSSGLRLVLCSTLILALVIVGAAGARMTRPPVSFLKSVGPLSAVQSLEMPPVDVARLRAEDLVNDSSPWPGAPRFAAAITVDFTLETSGTWEFLDDGSRLWRLRLRSPGALSLNLGFSRFDLPAGAGLWIYDPQGARVEGPYTRHHRASDGQLWTPVILGDEVVVEVHLPAGVGEARVELGRVGHGYRFFGEPPSKQGSCNIDVVCPLADPYRDQVRSVARYTVSRTDGTFFCTGQLVNNTAGDFRPYFLSARHCATPLSTGISQWPTAASSVVVYWNYESPTCGALAGGSTSDNQTGSTFRANAAPSDFVLVELNQMPDPSSNVYYAGWDASGATPQNVVGIHHPRGDQKAISFEGDPLVGFEYETFGVETHWQVTAWDLGTTEGGSSGSCIFDQGSKRCVGTLSAGTALCSNPTGFDIYGKFSTSWTGGGTNSTRLSNWLNPGGGTTSLAGADPNATGDDDDDDDGGGGEPFVCIPDETTLCLNGGRFQVKVDWRDFIGGTGDGRDVGFGSDDSGLLYFFTANNWEMLIKVLDGCDITGHYWVFAAATTNVEYTLTVTDSTNGVSKTYFNGLGVAAPAVTDTSAFATCP